MRKKYLPAAVLGHPDEKKHTLIDFGDDVGQMEFFATEEQTKAILERLSPERLGLALIRR